jgi:hypothetical protein
MMGLGEKLLNLQKDFENQQDRPRPAFKSSRRCAVRFSKK